MSLAEKLKIATGMLLVTTITAIWALSLCFMVQAKLQITIEEHVAKAEQVQDERGQRWALMNAEAYEELTGDRAETRRGWGGSFGAR